MTLTERRFAELIEAWGGDLRRWPEEWRDEAAALIAQSPAARAQLDAAQAFDALIDLPAPPAPSAALRRAILADGVLPKRRESWLQRLWNELGGFRLVGPAFAASLACGIAIAAVVDLQPETLDVADAYDAAEDGDLLAIAQLDEGYSEYAP